MPQNLPLFLYREKVEALANERQGEPLYNDSMEHAAIVLQSLLSRAERSIKLLTGELNRDTYGRQAIVKQVQRFLADKAHSVQILYENEALVNAPAEEHPFLRAVKGYSQVELRHVPRWLQSSYDFHFLLIDDDSYRFEPNTARFAAVAAFGDEAAGQNLRDLFSKLWQTAGPK